MLKKLIAIAAVSIAVQGVAHARSLPTGLTFKASANVEADYGTTSTGGTTADQDYYIVTKHGSGDTIYAGTSAVSTIYSWNDTAWKGKALANCEGYTAPTAGQSTFTGNWKVAK